jgi:hypothetical protein
MLFIEQPEQTARLVRDFLNEIEQAPLSKLNG